MEETERITITRITLEGKTEKEEVLVREVPFTIIVNGKELATLLCTPDGLHNLAVGFLASEGILQKKEDIKKMTLNEKGWYMHITLADELPLSEAAGTRLITSGCASAVSFYRAADARDVTPVESGIRLPPERVFSLMKEFQLRSSLFRETGGVHSSGLGSLEGVVAFAEDIGRHNAVDKVFGECLLKDIPTVDKILMTSGRVSSEILIKVARRQVPFVISPSAPTDLAVGLARKLNLTLIGFVRSQRMNVYSAGERID